MGTTTGFWWGDSAASPGVYSCGGCRGTGVVKVAFKARFCPQCKGKGTTTAEALGYGGEKAAA